MPKTCLSYEAAVIQWKMLGHKNHMSTHVITLWHVHITSLKMSVSAMQSLIEIHVIFTLKVIKSHFKGSYDKQNLTHMAISFEIYGTSQRLVS